jgi:hypothetical protein
MPRNPVQIRSPPPIPEGLRQYLQALLTVLYVRQLSLNDRIEHARGTPSNYPDPMIIVPDYFHYRAQAFWLVEYFTRPESRYVPPALEGILALIEETDATLHAFWEGRL